MSKFTDALVVTPMADGLTWVVLKDFGYDIGQEGSGNSVEVPVGFMTDFASAPRIFWALIPKWGKYGNAAVIHDFLYWNQTMSRKRADDILFEAMDVLKVSAFHKYTIYRVVRWFGGTAWRRNQWDRAAGFERVLQDTAVKSGQGSGRPRLYRRAWMHARGVKESGGIAGEKPVAGKSAGAAG